MESVTCAAYRCRITGVIFRGNNHCEAREEALKAFIIRLGLDYDEIYADQVIYMSFLNQWVEEQQPIDDNEGFSTNKREFVDREVAYIIALSNGRVNPVIEEKLDSEDL